MEISNICNLAKIDGKIALICPIKVPRHGSVLLEYLVPNLLPNKSFPLTATDTSITFEFNPFQMDSLYEPLYYCWKIITPAKVTMIILKLLILIEQNRSRLAMVLNHYVLK